jgi:hypothetical protein
VVSAGRAAILGDVGGHAGALSAALDALGGDLSTGTVPPDLTVIQVGDLIHKGPDSDGVVALVDRLVGAGPGGYVQLLGNHEASYLDGPVFGEWSVSAATAHTLRLWVRSDRARLAVPVASVEHGDLLVTHAGLTRWLWVELGKPPTAAGAADALNRLLHTDRKRAFAPGALLEGDGFSRGQPGVVWSAAGSELYASWLGHRPPFGQVHGHSSAYDWDRERWADGTPEEVAHRAVLDRTRRHLTISMGGKTFVGIDPGFGASIPPTPLVPLLLTLRADRAKAEPIRDFAVPETP